MPSVQARIEESERLFAEELQLPLFGLIRIISATFAPQLPSWEIGALPAPMPCQQRHSAFVKIGGDHLMPEFGQEPVASIREIMRALEMD
ncbi:hypothetical protein AB1M95_02930 [Sulfitobacter sp. LCG007]